MFATIWICTHEWSLIRSRATALTFAACHQPLSCASSLTRSRMRRSLRLPRTGTLILICAIACSGVRRLSRSASAETGCSIRSSVSGSRAMGGAYAVSGGVRRPVAVERRVQPLALHQLVVGALFHDPAVLEDDDQVGVADRRESVGDDEGRPA